MNPWCITATLSASDSASSMLEVVKIDVRLFSCCHCVVTDRTWGRLRSDCWAKGESKR